MDAQERLELKELIQEALTPIETRLSGVETQLSGVETRLSGMESRLDDLPTRDEVQAMVYDAYDKQAASALREFEDIRRQLASLETRVAKLENLIGRRLDNIDSALADQKLVSYDIRTEHAILRERIAELEERIARLEAAQHG